MNLNEKKTKKRRFTMKKRFWVWLIIIAIAILGTSVRLTAAYIANCLESNNSIVAPKVACEIVESDASYNSMYNLKNDITVKNTGNVRAYVKLDVSISYKAADEKYMFKDAQKNFKVILSESTAGGESVAEEPVAGEPVAGEPVAEEPVAGEPVAGEPVAGEESTEKSNWACFENTYYYTLPLSPDDTAEIELESIEFDGMKGSLREGAERLVANVVATAIQADPFNAVIEAWGNDYNGGVVLGVEEDGRLIIGE